MKTIRIDGVIGTGKDEVSASMIRDQLPEDGSDIHVKIHSEGGSAFEGFAIHDLLKDYPGKKTCTVESCAFSIASYIPMACDEIEITPNGYMMLHNPYMKLEGDDEAFAKQSDLLKNVKTNMINAYAEKSGKSVDEVQDMLKKETYLTASAAVESGLVDRITAKPVKSRVIAKTKNMPSGVVAALCGEASSGKDDSAKRKKPMEESKPVAATISMIRAAFPKASNEFLIKCMEKEMPIEEVSAEYNKEVEKENETLSARVKAMEDELASLKAVKACENDDEEEVKVSAKSSGVRPVAKGPSLSATVSARAKWSEIVEANVAKGMNRIKAAQMANRTHKDIREAMLAESNQ